MRFALARATCCLEQAIEFLLLHTLLVLEGHHLAAFNMGDGTLSVHSVVHKKSSCILFFEVNELLY